MKFLETLQNSIKVHSDRNAFFINGNHYTYQELGTAVNAIRVAIQEEIPISEKYVGLITNDDLETYAAIIALWFEGKAYVAINPIYPRSRNEEILAQTNSVFVMDSSPSPYFGKGFKVIATHSLDMVNNIHHSPPKKVEQNDIAYVIFTSGSTGIPKGAPVSFKNLNGFANAIDNNLSFSLSETDRCLQMFELTFDMSVVSYLAPLLKGACVYTVPKDSIKYFQIIKLLSEHQLTLLIMVPSIIHFLRPYFKEIRSESVRYSCFAGGKLYGDIGKEWNACIPNAQIINYYGPTETTIYCGGYLFDKEGNNKEENGVVSIGKPFDNTTYLVVDENNNEVEDRQTGELCIAGEQLFPGYIQNEERNKLVFFEKQHNGKSLRFYKSGDMCYRDQDGDYMYVGRADFQVKIRGFRVELGEIEYHVKKKLPGLDITVIDLDDGNGNTELGLAVCSRELDLKPTLSYLKDNLPPYMIPTRFLFVDTLPHSVNDKIDMKKLRTLFK